MFPFFWRRTASIWIAVLYMALGFPLLLFPGASGTMFVWTLAAGTAIYGFSHLWRYLQNRKTTAPSGGDLFLSIIPMSFTVFALLWPQAILSFLPLVLGALLLVDGIGKIPLVTVAVKERSSIMVPLLCSSIIPAALGILLVVNPFRAATLVIMIFGLALIADGVSDLVTALLARQNPPPPPPTSPA